MLEVHSVTDGLLEATVSYEHANGIWSQTFRARRLTLAQVDAELAAVGLCLLEVSVGAGRDWLIAAPAPTADRD